MESKGVAVLPIGKADGVPRETWDIKGRLKRNPYGMIAGALGMGYVVGGGLFTRLSARIFGTGLRVALLVALPSLEKQITLFLAGSRSNREKENDQ